MGVSVAYPGIAASRDTNTASPTANPIASAIMIIAVFMSIPPAPTL